MAQKRINGLLNSCIGYNILTTLLLGSVSAFSQTITIKDMDSKRPVQMVCLTSEMPRVQATTNQNGQAEMKRFKGSEGIEILSLGYKAMYKSYAELEGMDFELLLESSSIEIDEIVISATRWGRNSTDIPSRVSNISAGKAAFQNPQTAADLLGSSGEVFIQKSQQGGGSPMIRGFSTNRLLYSIDGVRMNSAIFRAGNIQNVISLDPFAIENTEVFFGPGSVMYGSDAIGGVMRFQTLSPQLSITDKTFSSVKGVARFSSANKENTGHLQGNIGWKKWAVLSSVSYSKYRDLKMGSIGPDEFLRPFFVQVLDTVDRLVTNPDPLVQNPTGYSQINWMKKILFKPNDQWVLDYAFHFSKTSDFSRYDRLIEQLPNGLPISAIWNYGPQKWMMNNLGINHSGNNFLYNEMIIRLAHQSFEESRVDRNFSGLQRFRLRTNRELVNAWSANVDLEKNYSNRTLNYGGEFVLNNVISAGSAVDIRNGDQIPVPDRYPNSVWRSYAAYLNYHHRIFKKFLLQAGARYSILDLESDFNRHLEFFPFEFAASRIQNSSLTGSMGAVYSPTETLKISLNLSTGFRAPNVDDIGKIFDFAVGEVVVPNTALKAEYAYNGEINISKVFFERIKIDVSGFYTYLDQAMVRREFHVNGQDSILYNGDWSRVYAIQNAAFGYVYGSNLGLEIELPLNLKLSSRFNYQWGIEEMDNGNNSRSRHAAPAFGITRMSYHKNKLLLELNAIYSSEVSFKNLNEEEKQKPYIYARDPGENPYSPGWYTINLKGMYTLNTNFYINVGIENLTDQRYRPYSSGLSSPGRNIIFSLSAAI